MKTSIATFALTCTLALTLAACESALVDSRDASDAAEKRAPDAVAAAKGGPPKSSVCHYDEDDAAYFRLDITPKALTAHIAHGDVPFDDDPADVDPDDGDGIYCDGEPENLSLIHI